MNKKIHIQNFKSIEDLDIELGRVNIIVGENGAGKSNILDAITLAYAASQDKLDKESLSNRGFRVTDPSSLKSGFNPQQQEQNILISITDDKDTTYEAELYHDNDQYSNWKNVAYDNIEMLDNSTIMEGIEEVRKILSYVNEKHVNAKTDESKNELYKEIERAQYLVKQHDLCISLNNMCASMDRDAYMVYTLNYSVLSDIKISGSSVPIDYNGGGLLFYVSYLKKKQPELYKIIEDKMSLFDWFEGLELPENYLTLSSEDNQFFVIDRFLGEGIKHIDYRCTSEGFLYTLFIFTVMIGNVAPKFFSIENIDTALNPKLCKRVIEEVVRLASEYDRQVIFTTHNPLVLDGIDLTDPSQRIFVAYRNGEGKTKLNRIELKNGLKPSISNSVAFSNGYFGGLTRGI